MLWRFFTILAVFICASTALAAGKVRTWTNTDGRIMQAEFVRELDGEVTFIKNGKLIVISLDKLSPQDQKIVKDLAAGKEVEDDPFSAPAAGSTPATDKGEETPSSKPAEKTEKPKKQIVIQTRTWTDRFGNKSSGKFVRMDGNDVVLNRGTRVITVPFASLSESDQEYVRETLTSQGKEDAIPSADLPNAGGGGGNIPGVGGIAGPGGGPGRPGGIAPPIGAGGGIPGRAPGMAGAPGMGLGSSNNPPTGVVGGAIPGGLPGMAGAPGMGLGSSNNPPTGVVGGAIPGGLPGMAGAPGTGLGGRGGPGAMGPIGPTNIAPGDAPNTAGPGGFTGVGGPMGTGIPGMPDPNMATGGVGAGPGTAGMPAGGMMPLPPTMGASGGMGAMPRTGPSNFGSPSMPPIGGPSFPGSQIEEYFECSKCSAKLTKQEAAGSTCPRCNTTWGFKQDEFGNKTMTTAGRGHVGTAAAVIVIFVLLGMVVFVALFVGIIVAIVKAASRPAPQPQAMPQQRYY